MDKIIKQIPNKIEYTKYKLLNGLTIVLVPDTKLLSVLVNLYIKVGSQYEPAHISGISHLLEHMSFKGTKNHPTNLELVTPLDNIGSSYNAGTGYELTQYFVRCGFQYIDTALNFISDIFQNSIFPEPEFHKEKGVVLEEIHMYEDESRTKVEDDFLKLIYGNQGAGRSIAGSEQTVKNITHKELLNYYRKYYNAKNAYLFIAGNFDPIQTRKLIAKYFNTAKSTHSFPYPKTKILQKRPKLSLTYKDNKETHFILGFHGYPFFDETNYALHVLETILSGGFTSRLFQLVREKLGGAYYIYSDNWLFFDRGIFIIRGGIDSQRAELIFSEIIKEIKTLKDKPLTNQELQKAKNYIIGKLFIKMDQPYYLYHYLTHPILYNHPIITPRQTIEKITKITPKDIQLLAQKIFRKNNANLAIVSSIKNKSPFNKVLNSL